MGGWLSKGEKPKKEVLEDLEKEIIKLTIKRHQSLQAVKRFSAWFHFLSFTIYLISFFFFYVYVYHLHSTILGCLLYLTILILFPLIIYHVKNLLNVYSTHRQRQYDWKLQTLNKVKSQVINEIIESEPCDISKKLLLNQHYDHNDPYLKTAVFERSHSQQDRRRVTLSGKLKQNTEIRQRLQQQDQHAKLMQSSRPIVTTTTQVDKAQSTSISMLASPELSDENQAPQSPAEDKHILAHLSLSTEDLLYLRYQFYTAPTVASLALKKSLPAKMMPCDNTLLLCGSQSAINRSTSLICSSILLQNLQSLSLERTWNRFFVIWLRDSILSEINESGQDVVCTLTDQQEQGFDNVTFTVHIFSHSYNILQETHKRLIELKPQSELFKLHPGLQTVPGLTDTFLLFSKNHHDTKIIKESDHEVRIYGFKSDHVQNCWTALKTYIDSNVIVTDSVSIGFWEAKYLVTKCSQFICMLEAKGCKVQYTLQSATQLQGEVKVALTGKLMVTKQVRKTLMKYCSLVMMQSVNLNCDTKYLSIWIQQWKEFIAEQNKTNNVLIEYQYKHQSTNHQNIEFKVVGIDSAAVAKAKNDLVQQENGSNDKLAKLDLTMTSEEFVVLLNNLKECETKLKQLHTALVILELDTSRKCAQLVTAPNKKPMLDALQADVMSFIASQRPKLVIKKMKLKDEVIGTMLTSKAKYLPMIEHEGNMVSVAVEPYQPQPNEFILKLTGGGIQVKAVELTIESIIKRLEATVTHAQLIVGGHNISITSTDSFKRFCSQLLKELHVHCMCYPPVGGDLLRQVHLKSKAGHIITLQIAIGQLSDERADAIVVPAESQDATMTNAEMNKEYIQFLQRKSTVGGVACINSGSFPSRKALHVALPKRCEQVEDPVPVDLVTACIRALDCASSKHFGSLSFPALGVNCVYNVSAFACVNTLLYCVDRYCQEKDTTLHTIRLVITQELSGVFLCSFDEYTFEALHQCEPSSSTGVNASSPPRYEWYWENDKKQFTQYSETVSNALTAAKLKNPDKQCYMWIDESTYLVDLSAMTQMNINSGYVRKVMYKKVTNDKTCSAKVQWYYVDDNKKFAAYSQTDSAKIEGMFQKVSGAGTYLQIHSRIYTFDFDNMKQVNVSTKYQRDIKREETPIKKTCIEKRAESELTHCVINLRGPEDNLQMAEQRVKSKLKSLSAFMTVPLPPASTPSLKQKLFSIAKRYNVSSSIRDDEKSKLLDASNQRSLQVIKIEGAEHMVDKAVTQIQGEIIAFHSQSSTALGVQADILYPVEWEAQTSTSQLFKLERYSQEQIRIISKFRETMPESDADIISIQRIQNKWLWERYSQHKERIREKNDGEVNEKELWHGSRNSSSDNIYNSEEGFDMRFSLNGLWGQANYFAVKASYSDMYAFRSTDGTKELLLAKVLTGDSFESATDSTLRMPPEKPRNQKAGNIQLKQLRYDSVTGITCDCRVYMTYSNDKAYPAYLISYSTTPKPMASCQIQVPPPPRKKQAFLARLRAQFSWLTKK